MEVGGKDPYAPGRTATRSDTMDFMSSLTNTPLPESANLGRDRKEKRPKDVFVEHPDVNIVKSILGESSVPSMQSNDSITDQIFDETAQAMYARAFCESDTASMAKLLPRMGRNELIRAHRLIERFIR